MIRVMLADDEPMALEDTLAMMDWQTAGFTIVGTANNGWAAWDLYKKKRPQIVIADICMPVMDGLKLSEKITQTGDDTVIFLLTSHESFQYAQTAMHLGIHRYLLKHEMTAALLTQELEKAKLWLAEKRQAALWNRQRLFLRMLAGTLPESDISQFAKPGDFALLLFVQSPPVFPPPAKPAPLPGLSMQGLAGQSLFLHPGCAFTIMEEGQLVAFFPLHSNSEQAATALATQLTQSLGELLHKIQPACHLFYETFCLTPTRPSEIFELWQTGAAYSFFDPPGPQGPALYHLGAVMADIGDEADTAALQPLLQNVQQAVLQLDREALALQLHTLFGTCSARPWSMAAWQWTVQELGKLMEQLDLHPDAALTKGQLGQERWQSIAQGERWFLKQFSRILEQRLAAAATKYSRNLTLATQYIKHHYSEDLSLDAVAGMAGISGVYLSQLFKRETGETFVEYLTKYRIEAAKPLLREKGYKIHQISKMVGFNSNQYFSQVFRKTTGMSPQDYRDKG